MPKMNLCLILKLGYRKWVYSNLAVLDN